MTQQYGAASRSAFPKTEQNKRRHSSSGSSLERSIKSEATSREKHLEEVSRARKSVGTGRGEQETGREPNSREKVDCSEEPRTNNNEYKQKQYSRHCMPYQNNSVSHYPITWTKQPTALWVSEPSSSRSGTSMSPGSKLSSYPLLQRGWRMIHFLSSPQQRG